ncbi:MAG: ABC transporter ATP-binding protein [Dehalococcoidia bacterium]
MLITTESLTKRYASAVALDALSVEIPPGVIGLLGPNGAGKSTLFKILLGLIEPTAGRAVVLEREVMGHHELRTLVGYMPEHDCFPAEVPAATMITHLAQISGLPYAAARERTSEVMRHVGLLEERYRELGTYSTGMKQRAKLAQALVHDPPLLLLDEPTNGLDPAGRNEMLELIRRTGHELGISIVLSSHLLDDVERVCDYIILIDKGRLVRAGAMSEFTEESQVLIIETDGGEPELAAALELRSVGAQIEGSTLLVDLANEGVYDTTLATVVELGLPLIRLERRRRSLVDLFTAEEQEVG